MSDTENLLNALNREGIALEQHWRQVRTQWRDRVAIDFETRHLRPIQDALQAYLSALADLDDHLVAAERAVISR